MEIMGWDQVNFSAIKFQGDGFTITSVTITVTLGRVRLSAVDISSNVRQFKAPLPLHPQCSVIQELSLASAVNVDHCLCVIDMADRNG